MHVSRILTGVGCFLLIAGGLWLWSTIGTADPVAQRGGAEAEHDDAAAAARSLLDPGRDPSRIEVDTLPQSEAPSTPLDSQPSASSVVLVGRCVDVETRQPVAGVAMRLRGTPVSELKLARYEQELRWRDPEPCASAADGRFVFVVEPEPPLAFRLEVEDPDWAAQEKQWPELTPGQRIDVGDLRVRRLHRAVAMVVDLDGRPVEGVGLRVIAWDQLLMAGYREARAKSTADGLARFEPGLTRGTHRFHVSGGPVWPSGGQMEVGIEGSTPRIVLERVPVAITGTVVDARGAPLPGILVNAEVCNLPPGPGTRYAATSAADGSFSIPGLHPAPQGWRIRTDRPFLSASLAERAIPNGTKDLRLALADPGCIALEVVDARDGNPVEHFAVGWEKESAQGTRASPPPVARRPDGRATLGGFPPGVWRISVLPANRELACSPAQRVTVGPGQTVPLRIALQPAPELRALVLHAGAPVAGARVDLLVVKIPGGFDRRSDAAELVAASGRAPGSAAIRIDEGATDTQGRVTLANTSNEPVSIRVRAEGYVPSVRPVSRGSGDVVVELLRGAKLRVRLEPPGIVQELARVSSVFMDGSHRGQAVELFRLPDDEGGRELLGRFGTDVCCFEGLEPGANRIGLLVKDLHRVSDGAWSDIAFEKRVIFSADAERELVFDLAAQRPGELELTLVTDTGPVAGGGVYVWPHSAPQDRPADGLRVLAQIFVQTDAEGRIPIQVLLPGSYSVAVRTEPGLLPANSLATSDGLLTVAPGARLSRTVLVRPRGWKLLLLGGDGQPMRNCHLRLTGMFDQPMSMSTDSLGWISQPSIPAERLEIELRRAENPARTFPWLPEGSEVAHARLPHGTDQEVRERTITLRAK